MFGAGFWISPSQESKLNPRESNSDWKEINVQIIRCSSNYTSSFKTSYDIPSMSHLGVMTKRPRSSVMDKTDTDSLGLLSAEAIPKATNETEYAPISKIPRFFSLTWRAAASFLGIEIVVLGAVLLAQWYVLPTHPHILPLCVIIPAMVTWSLYQTLSRSPLIRYDQAVRRLCMSTQSEEAPETCTKCAHPRLSRTHHCRRCERCTPRMSHHCGLLGVCLGAHNLKPFFLLLIYGVIGVSILAVVLIPRLLAAGTNLWRGDTSISISLVLWSYSIYLQACMAILLTVMIAFHLRLASQNWTILETTIARCLWRVVLPQIGHSVSVRSPYDRGSVNANLAEIFGTGVYAFIPVVDHDEAVKVEMTRGDCAAV